MKRILNTMSEFMRFKASPSLPDGWYTLPTEQACIPLKSGKLFDSSTVFDRGNVPVLNQTTTDFLGFHDEEPGVIASPEHPVVTFANHTCAMRLMKRSFSVIQNIFPKIGKPGVTDTVYFYYASLGRVGFGDYQGHHPIFRQTHIPIPPLNVQKRIADILSAYDQMIENNRRRVQILEAMIRALYREWFVHFRFPAHETCSHIASPLGKIPQGWELKKLGDVLELKYGKTLKKEDRRGGRIPVYGSSGIVGMHDAGLVEGPGLVLGRKGNVGSVFWSDTDFFAIDTAYYVLSSLPLRFLYYVLPTLNFVNNDSGVPGLNRSQAYALDILVPPPLLLQQFCELAENFERQASVLRNQIENFRSTRDLLLPRLLSGRIDVEPAPTVEPAGIDKNIPT